MPVYVDVLTRLDERAAAATARQIDRQFSQAGVAAGRSTGNALSDAIDRATRTTGAGITTRFSTHGTTAGKNFGSSFNSSVAQSVPASGAFNSALGGYSAAATKAGSSAGRAMGLAFTAAAGGIIGVAGATLFKGFERYQSIDAAKNRLENLNRTLTSTGRAGVDVGAVMDTVTKAVTDTPFALDQAFSIATRALSSNTGDLQRFMTVVTDTAGFTGESIESIGNAFIKISNTGKVSMEEMSNELRGIPLDWLAKQMGVTGAELSKMISDGKVGLNDLMTAVETNASGFAKASGETIAGAMANTQTAVARIGANLLGSVFGKPTEDGNDLVEVLKTVRARLDEINAWITANQGKIREVFLDGVQVVKDLGAGVKSVVDILDRMGIGVDDVVKAFLAWKAIEGVSSLTTSLTSISTLLGVGLPDAAKKGAGGITAALAKIQVPAWLSALPLIGPSLIPDVKPATEVGLPEVKFDAQGRPYIPGSAYDPGVPASASSGVDPTGGILAGTVGIQGPFAPGSLGGPAGAQRERYGNRQAPAAPAGNPILDAPGAGGGSGPKLPDAPVVPYDTTLPPGIAGLAPDASVFSAESSFLDARHALAEKHARLNQLLASNEATAEDIMNARNDVASEERDFQAAEMRMHEARKNQLESMTKQVDGATTALSELGAELDKDFGISKGLGGIVENFVKAAGNILAAPFLQALGMIDQANPNQGSGIIGMLASQGAFGPQYTPEMLQAAQMGPVMLQPGYGVPGASAAPSEAQVKAIAKQFGLQVTSEDRPGDPGYHGQGMALDVSNGSGNTPQMRAFAEYMSTNFGPHLKELIYSDGSFAGNIGDGKNVSGTGYYSQGTLSEHENHVHIAAAWGDSATQATGALTNLSTAATQATGSLWDAVAMAESSGNWSNQDTGNNGHYGGLQFSPETWRAYGGVDLTGQSNPANASREQQIEIANRTAFTGHNGLAPQGLSAWEAITNGSVPGVTANTPAAAFGVGPGRSWGGPVGLPNMIPGAGGQGYLGLQQGLGVGAGVAYPAQGGNSGNLVGGLALDGALAATAGLDMMMPGAGAAAKIGIQLMNRTVGYAAQNAGILASGALETLSLGDNPRGSLGGGWLGKIVGGLAGAAPALPNLAGGQKAPLQGDQAQQQGGNTYGDTNINVKNEKATEDQTGKVIAEHQAAIHAPAGRQP